MKREETDILFRKDSDDKLIFNPIGKSQPKFLFREFKNRLSYLRGEIASCEKNIDLLLGKKGEKKKEILNMIELEFFKRQLDIDREKLDFAVNTAQLRSLIDSFDEGLDKMVIDSGLSSTEIEGMS